MQYPVVACCARCVAARTYVVDSPVMVTSWRIPLREFGMTCGQDGDSYLGLFLALGWLFVPVVRPIAVVLAIQLSSCFVPRLGGPLFFLDICCYECFAMLFHR